MKHYQYPPLAVLREAFSAMLTHEGSEVEPALKSMRKAFRELRQNEAIEECNRLLKGHGIEAINLPEGDPEFHTDNGTRLCPAYSYVNMGDAYTMTLLRDHKQRRWLIASWGDVVEALPFYGVGLDHE